MLAYVFLFGLVWFGFSVKLHIKHPCRETVVVLLIPELVGAKRVPNFPNGISPKVNAILQLKFEIAYYNITVQHINHNAMVTGQNLFGHLNLYINKVVAHWLSG